MRSGILAASLRARRVAAVSIWPREQAHSAARNESQFDSGLVRAQREGRQDREPRTSATGTGRSFISANGFLVGYHGLSVLALAPERHHQIFSEPLRIKVQRWTRPVHRNRRLLIIAKPHRAGVRTGVVLGLRPPSQMAACFDVRSDSHMGQLLRRVDHFKSPRSE